MMDGWHYLRNDQKLAYPPHTLVEVGQTLKGRAMIDTSDPHPLALVLRRARPRQAASWATWELVTVFALGIFMGWMFRAIIAGN